MKKMSSSCLAAGAGKTNPTVRHLNEHPMVYTNSSGKPKRMGEIIYVTTRQEVESLDLSRFMANFGHHLPRRKIGQAHGRIIFTVHGYDQVDEEIYVIPEVRLFYAMAHESWPCWLYTACLASASLRVIALSIAANMWSKRTGNKCRNWIPEHDLKIFYTESLSAAHLMFYRAGISKKYATEHLKIAAKYLEIRMR